MRPTRQQHTNRSLFAGGLVKGNTAVSPCNCTLERPRAKSTRGHPRRPGGGGGRGDPGPDLQARWAVQPRWLRGWSPHLTSFREHEPGSAGGAQARPASIPGTSRKSLLLDVRMRVTPQSGEAELSWNPRTPLPSVLASRSGSRFPRGRASPPEHRERRPERQRPFPESSGVPLCAGTNGTPAPGALRGDGGLVRHCGRDGPRDSLGLLSWGCRGGTGREDASGGDGGKCL